MPGDICRSKISLALSRLITACEVKPGLQENKPEDRPINKCPKRKTMTTGEIGEVIVDETIIFIVEVVTSFLFLGALITKDALCDNDVRK